MKNYSYSLVQTCIAVLTWTALTFGAVHAQGQSVTVSGTVLDKASRAGLPFANAVLKTLPDSSFSAGTIADEEGRFTLSGIKPGEYFLEVSMLGYSTRRQALYAGSLSGYLNVPPIEMEENEARIEDVVITGRVDDIGGRMDKKAYAVEDNISQSGGSVLQAMQNLPGVTVQDGKVQLRGNDKVVVLIDGKQTALTGFGNQSGLDNIPASSIERIEIINNPSSKYDANGNGGIINIIFRKDKQEGFNGKLGFSTGLGALWVRRENLPSIRPQYRMTPKLNPSFSLNYRKGKVNLFVQADNLYTQTLNKNEFVTRAYDDGTVIRQQTKRNRNTNFLTTKAGFDLAISQQDMLTVSGLFGSEKIIDRGDQPFFNGDLSERLRLWQFLEDELKTTAMGTASFQHKFKEPGHLLNAGFNYTFHREDEKYFFTNTLATQSSEDAFKLISDERVADLSLDYVRPLRYGRIEVGGKFRRRTIPTDMQFIPGLYSVLDINAGGKAVYKETNPAIYGTYVLESRKVELELGLRMEYVGLRYEVDPGHNTYKSDGYNYAQPFPTLRMAYKFNERNKLAAFYNRRVDRPNEVDIRVFPKYDDAEIIKVGNPALLPQFSNAFELGYKSSWQRGYLYAAAYHRISDGTITRISSTVAGSNLIYAIFQNAGRSQNSGMELVISQEVAPWYSFNVNLNGYRNRIDAFTVENLYPVPNLFSADRQQIFSGSAKMNHIFALGKSMKAQLTVIYLAPDIIPQGRIDQRFSIDLGIKKTIQEGKGELFVNATDLLNTMVVRKEIQGDGFKYTSTDYNETQVVRMGYSYKF
jgi:outer membrane receptor protein involved in Fe transport